MTVSTKGKRKIVVNGRTFLWWVSDADPEYHCFSTTALMVVSVDGRFGVRFYLQQPADKRFLIVLGPDFNGLPDAGGPWIRLRCPEWQTRPAITPDAVRRLVQWCESSDRELTRVDYLGAPIAISQF